MPGDSLKDAFSAALASLVEQLEQDKSVLASILCGSLSHDAVWAKSDIDLALVTADDKKADRSSLSVNADGINVHIFMMPRTEFRKQVEGTVRNSFFHSLLAKGRLLYSHDETVADLFAGLQTIGERDRQLQLLRAGVGVLPSLYKAHKWMITRRDLDYTALWLLYAATPLAQIEVLTARELIGREVILDAMRLNPVFFKIVYTDLLNTRKTAKTIQAALDAVDTYMTRRARSIFSLVFDHLRDAGEARSCTEIDDHFQKSYGFTWVVTACEYLADEGLIGKASIPARVTKRSTVEVQELAFFSHD